MKIEEYLQSPQAVEDLGHWERPGNPWLVMPRGAWQCATFEHLADLAVYYRPAPLDLPRNLPREVPAAGSVTIQAPPEPPLRYLVTDLGEAVRALKIRTGIMEGARVNDAVSGAATGVLGKHTDGARVVWTWNGGDLYLPTVAAADLPRAICDVLLAAYRVAGLEVA